MIVTVTLNAALHVAYTTGDTVSDTLSSTGAEGITPVSRPARTWPAAAA